MGGLQGFFVVAVRHFQSARIHLVMIEQCHGHYRRTVVHQTSGHLPRLVAFDLNTPLGSRLLSLSSACYHTDVDNIYIAGLIEYS